MTTTKENINFTLGENFGVIITNIAQEHLLYGLNPEKAVNTITGSLIGCSKELALQILKGDMVINIDTENQDCFVSERNIGHDALNCPKINIKKWYETQTRLIWEHGFKIKDILKEVSQKLKYNHVRISINYQDIFKFLAGNDKDKLQDYIYENEGVCEIDTVVRITKDFITKSLQTQDVMDWMRMSYPSEFENDDFYIPDWREYSSIVREVMTMFQRMINANSSSLNAENKELDTYIESVKEINDVLSKGIEPVDLMQNYSAGWLSPDGKYYALNGEMANMLHNQIADALQKAGIIPKDLTNEGIGNNPDAWLEQHGWVKIHGNKIEFAGCLNDMVHKENLDMTNVQVDAIYKYIQVCYHGVMRLGWKMEEVSAARFEMMANDNMEYLNRNYFKF